MLSLLLAVSISSQQIGQFFDLPIGVPLSVSSFNTPGSDPALGEGGWYVPELTNAIIRTERWNITANGTPIEGDSFIPYHAGGTYDIEEAEADIFNALAPSSYEYVGSDPSTVDGDESDDELSFSFYSVYRTDGGEYGTMDFFATAIRVITNQLVETGRYIPRSPRLTPEVMAGVNSTFEGFFERQYYAGQGQSNIWDVTQWGPRTDFKRFWFDPYWMRSGGTNANDRYLYNGWDYSTNRTMTTRRLVDYDAINSLGGRILNTCKMHDFSLVGPVRPGWIDSAESDVATSDCYWSTTDTKILDGASIVPSFTWVENPMIYADWSKCSQVMSVFDDDSVWTINWRSYPTVAMMADVHFGQSRFIWDWFDAKPDMIDDVSFGDLIATNFPHADPYAITNGTRRLFSDRLCCMNQALSLMDRTYHVPDIAYPTEGTNTTYHNQLWYTGHTTGTATFDTDHYNLTSFGTITWDSPVSTNWSNSSYRQSSGEAIHNYISTTRTEDSAVVGYTQPVPSPFTPEYGIEQELVDEAIAAGLVINEGDFVSLAIQFNRIVAGGVVVTFWVNNETTGEYNELNRVMPFSMTNCTVDVYYQYRRAYDYTRTFGVIDLGPTQPGWQAGDRLKAAKMGSVVGVHRQSGNVSGGISQVMSWSSKSNAEYKSKETAYNTRSTLLLDAIDDLRAGYGRFVTHYGVDPTLWASIIPINGGDCNRVRNSIVLNSAEIKFEEKYVCVAWGHCDSEGHFSVEGYESWPNDGSYDYSLEWRPICSPYVTAESITKDSPQQSETDGLRTDAKIGIVTRVDWNWKTLKRGSD